LCRPLQLPIALRATSRVRSFHPARPGAAAPPPGPGTLHRHARPFGLLRRLFRAWRLRHVLVTTVVRDRAATRRLVCTCPYGQGRWMCCVWVWAARRLAVCHTARQGSFQQDAQLELDWGVAPVPHRPNAHSAGSHSAPRLRYGACPSLHSPPPAAAWTVLHIQHRTSCVVRLERRA